VRFCVISGCFNFVLSCFSLSSNISLQNPGYSHRVLASCHYLFYCHLKLKIVIILMWVAWYVDFYSAGTRIYVISSMVYWTFEQYIHRSGKWINPFVISSVRKSMSNFKHSLPKQEGSSTPGCDLCYEGNRHQ